MLCKLPLYHEYARLYHQQLTAVCHEPPRPRHIACLLDLRLSTVDSGPTAGLALASLVSRLSRVCYARGSENRDLKLRVTRDKTNLKIFSTTQYDAIDMRSKT